MDFPKNFLINYKNQPIPVYVVGDIRYCYFVVKFPKQEEVHLNLEFEEDGKMKWVEVNGSKTERAVEIGKTISRQMEKDGYRLETLKLQL